MELLNLASILGEARYIRDVKEAWHFDKICQKMKQKNFLVVGTLKPLLHGDCASWARAVQGLFWLAGFGQGIIHGLRGVCVFSAPQPNPAVKRDAALVRVAPYF